MVSRCMLGGLPEVPTSHGCVHLPLEFAKLLFGITTLGCRSSSRTGEPAYGDMQHPGLLIANHTEELALDAVKEVSAKRPLFNHGNSTKCIIRLFCLLSRPQSASSSHLLIAREVFQRRSMFYRPKSHLAPSGVKA